MLMILLLQIIIVSHILPITKCCSEYISWVILLNPHNRTLGLGLLLTPLNRCGKWAQRDYKLIFSKISQLVRGRGLESVFRAVFSASVLILEPLCADMDQSCLHSSLSAQGSFSLLGMCFFTSQCGLRDMSGLCAQFLAQSFPNTRHFLSYKNIYVEVVTQRGP